MSLERQSVVVGIGAAVAVLLQIVVAPNIAIFSSQPNFLLAYVLVAAIARPADAGVILPFALGLLCDLLGTGPVGAYACLFVVASFVVSRAFLVLDNDTLFMPLTLVAAAAFLSEMFYGVILVVFGSPCGMLDVFLYRALPCSLYDCVAALVLYPVVAHFVGGSSSNGPRTPRLR